MENRLYRSKTDAILGGVCSGLAKYLVIDPTLVRLAFVLVTLAGGAGVLIYIVMWIIVPEEGTVQQPGTPQVLSGEGLRDRFGDMRDDVVDAVRKPNPAGIRILGFALVIYGAFLIIQALHLPWLNWLSSDIVWAGLLILGGAALIWRYTRKEN
jgi:phage shock protein PspC (stress-responsive transcriptional regulator)